MLRFKRLPTFNSHERFGVRQRCLFTLRFRSGFRTTENELLVLSGNIDFVEGKQMGSLLYDCIIVEDHDKLVEFGYLSGLKLPSEFGDELGSKIVCANFALRRLAKGDDLDVLLQATGLTKEYLDASAALLAQSGDPDLLTCWIRILREM